MKHGFEKSVLFVCMGNICRSPTGEGIFQHLLAERGLDDRVYVDSAGTIAYHVGNLSDPRMREAAHRRGYELTSRARQIQPEDLREFDLVIVMDEDNLHDVRELAATYDLPADPVRKLGEYLDPVMLPDVPDPYYGGAQGFEQVIDMIERACPKILDALFEESVPEPRDAA